MIEAENEGLEKAEAEAEHVETHHLHSDEASLSVEQPLVGAFQRSVAVRLAIAEASERFCYHGITSVYIVYMQEMLGFSSGTISAVTSGFNFVAYGFVLVGGYVADRYLGRRCTLLLCGIVFLLGLLLLAISSSPVGFKEYPLQPTWAPVGLGVGLALSALGTAGIQSSAAPFAVDQVAQGSRYHEKVSQYYFWSNSLGAVLGMLLVPLVRRIELDGLTFPITSAEQSNGTFTVCKNNHEKMFSSYFLSFASLCLVMIMAITMIIGRSFVHILPSTTVFNPRYLFLLRCALRERQKQKASMWSPPKGGRHWLDWALVNNIDACHGDENLLNDIKMLLSAFVVFAFFPFYWFVTLQLGKMLVLQASIMQVPQNVTVDQIAAAEPVLLLLFLPLADKVLFPELRKRGFKLSAITRITIGFGIGIIAMISAIVLQAFVRASGEFVPCGNTSAGKMEFIFGSTGGVNVFMQIVVYVFVAISQGFASVASLEFAMEHSPTTLKSSLTGWSFFQVALGALLGLAVSPVTTLTNFMWIFTGMTILIVMLTISFHIICKSYS